MLEGPAEIPQKVAKSASGIPHVDDKGNYNPDVTKMDPNGKVWQRKEIHDGKIHGEK